MTLDKTQQLFEAFPYLYRRIIKFAQESSMEIGFDCGNGWFDLIWTLSLQIEQAARQSELDPHSDAWPEVMQVKQKLGTLRFYLFNRTEAMTSLIDDAEEASAKTCEECGMPGLLVANSGFETLCKQHAK